MDPDKVEAIKALKSPLNRAETQRLLVMVTYLGKFIPNLSKLREPLQNLLKKETAFQWETEHSECFKKIKKVLSSPPVLTLYDVNKAVTLSVDASSKSLGAALLQDKWPVAYGSRTLTKAEQNHPKIEKEAIAVLFGCKYFISTCTAKNCLSRQTTSHWSQYSRKICNRHHPDLEEYH